MNKKILITILLITLTASGVFALNLSLGLNGALYMDDGEYNGWDDRFEAFQEGERIYYGLMIEILGDQVGIGGNFFSSIYESSFGMEMIDMDLNLALSYHLLGSTFFLDPFGEIGIGYISKDYTDDDIADIDGDMPVTAMGYWFAGLGAGLNLGAIGFYGKFLYHFNLGAPAVEDEFYDKDGQAVTVEYTLEEYALKPYKFVLGAKLIL